MVPFIWPQDDLVGRDFILFELQFSRTISYFLPCETVDFMPVSHFKDVEDDGSKEHNEISETWRTGIDLVKKERQPIVNSDGTLLFLPIWRTDDMAAVAIISGGSSLKYGDYSAEWFHERSRLISRELRKLKQWAFDPESGLLHGRHLREEMVSLLGGMSKYSEGNSANTAGDWSVFLIEIFPKARNSGQSTSDIARAAACLNSFIGDLVPLSHFGSGLFGMLWNSENDDDFRKLGYALLRKIKRQNFAKVHIGVVPLTPESGVAADCDYTRLADSVLNEAWSTLQKARRRGPFAICSATGERAERIFRKPSPAVFGELKKIWRHHNKFSVALLQADEIGQGEKQFPKRICSLVGNDAVLLSESGCEAYLYLHGKDEAEALTWLTKLNEKINKLGGVVFSMGVAGFPCSRFTKSEIPVNARKALAHSAFFGPGSVTAFDGVSLNISGDVYYEEGDLTGAVREYKRGLKIDSENINLRNSLAVIYAQINRYHQAIPLFEKVLVLDSKDFMALFNMGFAYLRSHNLTLAADYFERAMKVDGDYFDLLLQLGKIYCKLEKYHKAVKVLVRAEKNISSKSADNKARPWLNSGNNSDAGADIGFGLVFRYLGEAYHGIGKNKESMSYLQKAIAYNARDAGALSRLGELYFVEKQGEDIAISLCKQAVNIDEANGVHLFRLANIQFKLNEMQYALASLQRCLIIDRKNICALLLMGNVYEILGKVRKARLTYERVLRLDSKNKQANREIDKCMPK